MSVKCLRYDYSKYINRYFGILPDWNKELNEIGSSDKLTPVDNKPLFISKPVLTV